ncbi:RidA family protein [Paracoccus zhejiangensis]|uniref:Enamine deaminase RidA n=1 Tax=Paracoccus zhejiangensis TaxID=1077935 RepID=A0A2H5F0V7_9RHOB|nr:RidA family protein [Paracoccus zhejiangensis]AUH65172.1 hypothetical protein CX676_14160 [Paracoccus zhejiangensis]
MRNLLFSGALAALVLPAAALAAPEFLNSGDPAGMPFSEAVRSGNTVYLSGQLGIAPGASAVVEGGIEAESTQVMENIKRTLEAHGLAMTDLVKCTVMLADMAEWGAFNEVYKSYFEEGKFPARSAFGAAGLALGGKVEVECIAEAPAS